MAATADAKTTKLVAPRVWKVEVVMELMAVRAAVMLETPVPREMVYVMLIPPTTISFLVLIAWLMKTDETGTETTPARISCRLV